MGRVTLEPFLRPGLDVLFVALNPSVQSNDRGHYFSGKQSRFFKLLGLSGLTVCEVDKAVADNLVFGDTELNHAGSGFGVVDLVDDLVETASSEVVVEERHVRQLLDRIRVFEPRFVCVIHSKVRDAVNRSGQLTTPLQFGFCGRLLDECQSEWVFNYFSNGNNIPDRTKLQLYRQLKDRL